MSKFVAGIAAGAALVTVGVVAGVQAFQPFPKAPSQVRLVQPAGQSIPVPAQTVAVPAPTVTVTVAPKPKPVASRKAKAVQPRTVTSVKRATVSEPTSDPTPTSDPAPPPARPITPPPMIGMGNVPPASGQPLTGG